ncbi:carboxypeptidase-like regulatory domain-containing protein [Granulicella rosea]|uniref:carboxypeptidase-like regulatory domain-containing protein n=1 Tax=Granulicella rosea TaxID=474952 RepID=UPI0015955299|nr:carboxypeptidase-like regulatory domain-containing protein [Granulicella rosea]
MIKVLWQTTAFLLLLVPAGVAQDAKGKFDPDRIRKEVARVEALVNQGMTVRGVVLDPTTRQPVADAVVSFQHRPLGEGRGTRSASAAVQEVQTTRPDGSFEFSGIPWDSYYFDVSKTGYEGVTDCVVTKSCYQVAVTASAEEVRSGRPIPPMELKFYLAPAGAIPRFSPDAQLLAARLRERRTAHSPGSGVTIQVHVVKDMIAGSSSGPAPCADTGMGEMGGIGLGRPVQSTPPPPPPLLSPARLTLSLGEQLFLSQGDFTNRRSAIPSRLVNPESLEFADLDAGSYRILIQKRAGSYVDAITAGGRDLEREPLVVGEEKRLPPVEIRLRTDCGGIHLVKPWAKDFHDPIGIREPYYAVVVPQSSSATVLQPYMLEDLRGSEFVVGGLKPGHYKVYLVHYKFQLEMATAKNIERFAKLAGDVQVRPNERVDVRIDGDPAFDY